MTPADSIREAVETLEIEMHIAAALDAYAKDAGRYERIEDHQAGRVDDALERLIAIVFPEREEAV